MILFHSNAHPVQAFYSLELSHPRILVLLCVAFKPIKRKASLFKYESLIIIVAVPLVVVVAVVVVVVLSSFFLIRMFFRPRLEYSHFCRL